MSYLVAKCATDILSDIYQLEFICRRIRAGTLFFGGIQVVLIGDWFQIPPVPNTVSNDPGKHCFTSYVWKSLIKHKFVLTEVFRQSDIQLITAVNELERGTLSASTNVFMRGLSRPLKPGSKPTYLFARNFDVDWHNAVEIEKLPGPLKLYTSLDSGKTKNIKNITAKEKLCLKISCPVILLRNLDKLFVNGMQGTVVSLEDDGPTVKFLSGTIKLKREIFTVYNANSDSIETQRLQFPIVPSFAITIHKAQGLTIPCLVVNCSHVFSPGQIGVAIGRAVNTADLQVLNYLPECAKKHQSEVYDFCAEAGIPVNEDISCCRDIPFFDAYESDGSVHIAFPEDDDYEADFLWENEPDVQQSAVPDTLNSTDVPNYKKYTVEEATQILKSFKCDLIMTPSQKMMNDSIDYICQFPEKLTVFFDGQFQKLSDLKGVGNITSVKEETAFLTKYHSYLKSEFYITSCKQFFSPLPVYKLLAGQIVTYIRKCIVDKAKSCSILEELKPRPVIIPESGKSKIRYVSGYAVAKLKNKYMNLVRNALNSYTVLDTNSKVKVDLLESMIVRHADVMENTKYPASITEITRKQNITFGLTNICDEMFEFFLSVEKKRLPLYDDKYLQRYKSDLLQYIHTSIKSDKDLLEQFSQLFKPCNVSWIHALRVDTSDETEGVVNDIVQGSVILTELYDELIDKYLSVTDSEYRRKLLANVGQKKTMEHRKQILLPSKVSSSLLSMSTMQQDKTPGCASSHWKLKGTVMQDKKQLGTFTKNELIHLGNAYGVKLSKVHKKEILIETLSTHILTAECMTHPHLLNNSSQHSQTSSVIPTSNTDSCIQSLPSTSKHIVFPTAQNTQPKTPPSNKPKDKNDKIKGKGKRSATGKVTAKGCRKSKRKYNKKKADEDVDIEDYFCGECEGVYHDEDEEPWIGCCLCQKWYHRSCGALADENKWAEYSKEDVTWHCPSCVNNSGKC